MTDNLKRMAEEDMARARRAGYVEDDPLPTLASVFTSERKPLGDKGAEHLVSMTFKSSSGGAPHVVTLTPYNTVNCTCEAMLSVDSRPALCWAAQEFRAIKGLPRP